MNKTTCVPYSICIIFKSENSYKFTDPLLELWIKENVLMN